jgi:1-deoxy-D-xylulose-5-phosphate reductoisomerase
LNYPQLTFEQADTETFRNLALAFEAMNKSGNAPCVLNAANEIAVQAFLKDTIGFLEMSDLIEKCLEQVDFIEKPSYDDYVETDKETRRIAQQFL